MLSPWCSCLSFFFNDTATTEIYTLSLHDALPICASRWRSCCWKCWGWRNVPSDQMIRLSQVTGGSLDRHGDGAGLEADGDRGTALRRHRGRLPPARLLEIAERADHADELRVRLELASVLTGLGRLQLEFLAPDQ